MSSLNKSEVFQSLKSVYQFIVDDFGYQIIDEERSTPLLLYIRYENKAIERVISVSMDLRENDFNISIWKSADGWTRDGDLLEFESYLSDRGLPSKIRVLPEGVLDLDMIREVNQQNADSFRKYGKGLISGEDY